MSKRIDDKTYEKFKRDVALLRERTEYTDEQMAKRMGTSKGNFSTRVNDLVRPGLDFIKRFYGAFREELKELEVITVVNDPKQDFPNTIGLLKEQGKKIEKLEKSVFRLEKMITTLILRLDKKQKKAPENDPGAS